MLKQIPCGKIRYKSIDYLAPESFAKIPFLPDFCTCPVECKAKSSGIVKIFAFLEPEQKYKISTFQRSPPIMIFKNVFSPER
jgi:hypothetical protein